MSLRVWSAVSCGREAASAPLPAPGTQPPAPRPAPHLAGAHFGQLLQEDLDEVALHPAGGPAVGVQDLSRQQLQQLLHLPEEETGKYSSRRHRPQGPGVSARVGAPTGPRSRQAPHLPTHQCAHAHGSVPAQRTPKIPDLQDHASTGMHSVTDTQLRRQGAHTDTGPLPSGGHRHRVSSPSPLPSLGSAQRGTSEQSKCQKGDAATEGTSLLPGPAAERTARGGQPRLLAHRFRGPEARGRELQTPAGSGPDACALREPEDAQVSPPGLQCVKQRPG